MPGQLLLLGLSLEMAQRVPSACFLEVQGTNHHHTLSANGLNMKGQEQLG